VKEAFNRRFFDPGKNQYDRNSQTANAMPLVLGLVPEDRRAAVLDGLAAQIRAGATASRRVTWVSTTLCGALDGGQSNVLYTCWSATTVPGMLFSS